MISTVAQKPVITEFDFETTDAEFPLSPRSFRSCSKLGVVSWGRGGGREETRGESGKKLGKKKTRVWAAVQGLHMFLAKKSAHWSKIRLWRVLKNSEAL